MTSYADVVQSVDRAKLVTALSAAAVRGERELGCLIQVALDAESGERGERGGVAPDGVEELARWPTTAFCAQFHKAVA